MTLSKREKVLAGVVAALAAGLLLWLGFGLFSGPLDTLRTQIAVHTANLEKLQDQVLRAKKAQDQMTEWNRQALPSDVSRAGSLYQAWLLEAARKAGFRQTKVEPGEVRTRGDSCQQLPFTVRGQASLEEMVKFLYDFYSAGHLHQIRRLTLRPIEKSKDLDAVITVEALSLASADRKDQLTQVPSKRLELANLDEYRKAIVERNIMSPPRPPVIPPPSKPAEPEKVAEPFDASRFAYITGIVEVNGEPQVWVKARTTDDKYQLRRGEKFQMGPFSATIARIDPRSVEVEVDGRRHTIPLGSSVRGAEADAKSTEAPKPKPEREGPKAEGRGPRPEGMEPKGEGGAPRPEGRRRRDRNFPRPDGGDQKGDEGLQKGPGNGPPPEGRVRVSDARSG